MVVRLLPNSIAPSSRSRVASSRLTIVASRLPCFSSRIMAAREDAVSAVSLAEKNADTSQADHDRRTVQPVENIHRSASFSSRKARTSRAIDAGVDEGCADPAHQNECRHSALYFLVLRHQIHQPVDRRQLAGNVLRPGRQADLGQMADGALGFGGRQQACAAPKIRTPAPCRRRPLRRATAGRKNRSRLQRMAEGVAEIEQLPVAGFALVARDDRRLGAAAHGDGVLARKTSRRFAAGENLAPVGLQPGEERGVAEQAVFDDLGIAGAEFARRQACRACAVSATTRIG